MMSTKNQRRGRPLLSPPSRPPQGIIYTGRSSRVRPSRYRHDRGRLDDDNEMMLVENISMLFHPSETNGADGNNSDDDLSKYDYSMGAPSYLDQKNLIRLDSINSTDFAFRGANRFAQHNISMYSFRYAQSEGGCFDEKEEDDDDCDSGVNDGTPQQDDILGSLADIMKKKKFEVRSVRHPHGKPKVMDDQQKMLLLGIKDGGNQRPSYAKEDTEALSAQQETKEKKGKLLKGGFVRRWFRCLFRANKRDDNRMTHSLQESSTQRPPLQKTKSEMRRASF